MNTLEDKLNLLVKTKDKLRASLNLPSTIPFSQYAAYANWKNINSIPNNTTYVDFENQRYSKNGVPCDFNDLFDFNRAGKAWLLSDEGLVEYSADTPRHDNGLLIENTSTNYIHYNAIGYELRGVGTDSTSLLSLVDDNTFLPSVSKVIKSSVNPERPSNKRYAYSYTRDNIALSHSVYIKAPLQSKIGFDSGSRAMYVSYDLETKEIFTNGLGTYKIKPYKNNWTYIGKTVVENDIDLYIPYVYFKDTSNTSDSAFFALRQAEMGELSSFIKTEYAPVTRPSDYLIYKPSHGFIGAVLTGDWDSTLTLKLENGQLVHSGYGKIRNIKITVPKLVVDFENQTYIKNGVPVSFNEALTFNRAGKAWLVKSDGLKEYAIDIPRYDNGLVIENESTNLCRYSDIYSNWTSTGVVKSISSSYGAKITEDTTNIYRAALVHGISDSIATVSFIVKPYGINSIMIGSAGSNDGVYSPVYDLINSKVIGSSFQTSDFTIENLGTLGFKISATKFWGGGYSTPRLYFLRDIVGNTKHNQTTYVGDGVSAVTVDYPQFLTVPSINKSVIITDSAPVTRPSEYIQANITGTTVTGNWDSTLNLYIENGQLKHTGYGKIRTLEIN